MKIIIRLLVVIAIIAIVISATLERRKRKHKRRNPVDPTTKPVHQCDNDGQCGEGNFCCKATGNQGEIRKCNPLCPKGERVGNNERWGDATKLQKSK